MYNCRILHWLEKWMKIFKAILPPYKYYPSLKGDIHVYILYTMYSAKHFYAEFQIYLAPHNRKFYFY